MTYLLAVLKPNEWCMHSILLSMLSFEFFESYSLLLSWGNYDNACDLQKSALNQKIYRNTKVGTRNFPIIDHTATTDYKCVLRHHSAACKLNCQLNSKIIVLCLKYSTDNRMTLSTHKFAIQRRYVLNVAIRVHTVLTLDEVENAIWLLND